MSTNDGVPYLDPEIAAGLSKRSPPSTDKVPTIQEIRAGEATFHAETIQYQKEMAPPESEYKVEDCIIDVNGTENLVRIVIPTPASGRETQAFPLMVWFHGGGYAFGSANVDDYLLRRVSVKNQIVIANVEYRLAPENPLPTGLDDAYEGLKWVVENASSFSASPALGLIVGGSSAGGNFTANAVLRARDDPFFAGRPVTGQFLQIPQLLHPLAELPEKYKPLYKSMSENAKSPILSRDDIITSLARVGAGPNDPRLSVLLVPDLSRLPKAYFQVSGADPLRDDSLIYENILKEAGTETKVELYPGYPHVGHYIFPRAAISRKFFEDIVYGVSWLLK